MQQICTVNFKYFALYVLLFLPRQVWDWIHQVRTKRAGFAEGG